MEALIKLAAENVVILGSVVVVLLSFFLFMWCRKSYQTPEVDTPNDFWLEETQNKTKKTSKIRPKKTKTEKITSTNVPNGTLNKLPVKSAASAEKTLSNGPSGGSAKSEDTKRSKDSAKKQPKSSEKSFDISGDWTVAASKKKPKTKKESSPSKDEDRSDQISSKVVETISDSSAVAEQAKLEQQPVSASDSDSTQEKNIESLLPTPTIEHVAPVVETTAELDVAVACTEEVQDRNHLDVGKSKKKKNKKNKSDVSQNTGNELVKVSEEIPNGDRGTVASAVQSVAPDSEPCALSDKTDVPSTESILSLPSPVLTESEPVKSDDSSLSSSLQAGIVFDELGDDASLAVAPGKKSKKKPRREN